MSVLITPLHDVDIIADPTGSNCIAEVSGSIVRIATQKIIDMVSTQVQDPNRSELAQTVVNITENMNHAVEQIETINGRLDSSDTNIGTLQTNYNELASNVSEIETNVSNNSSEISTINDNISTINNSLSTLDSTVSGLSSFVNSIDTRLKSVESSISSYKTRLEELEGYLTLLNILANGQ